MNLQESEAERVWVHTGTSMGTAVLGVAAGLLASEMVHRAARKPLAFALFGIGVAALSPGVVEGVREVAMGPRTRAGAKRTLRSIRDAGATTEAQEFVDEPEMFVG